MLNSVGVTDSQMNYIMNIINDSKDQYQEDQASEYIDLTREDDSSEDEKDISSNNTFLGNKTQREKENNNKNTIQKTLTFNNSNNSNVIEELNLPSNNNTYFPGGRNNINSNNEKEREELLNLVKVEGFNKIFNLITKLHFDQRNPVEKKLEEIIFNIGLLQTSLILLQIKFTISPGIVPIPFTPAEIEKKKRESDLQDLENKGYILGEHLHKDKNGKIFKYLKHHLRVKNIFVYYCGDKSCKSRGLYNIKNMNFKVVIAHSFPHEKHNYIMIKYKYEQYQTVFNDFKQRNCSEAQIFKNEQGDKLVKWYNSC